MSDRSPHQNEEWERMAQMYESGLSIPEVSEATDVPQSTVRHRIKRAGVDLRTRAEGVRLAESKGRIAHIGNRTKRSKATIQKLKATKKANRVNCKWARVNSNGYLEVTTGGHVGRAVHRVLVEVIIGRPLKTDEHVHHKDGDKTNNDPRNLEILSSSEHARSHRKMEPPRERNELGQFKPKESIHGQC